MFNFSTSRKMILYNLIRKSPDLFDYRIIVFLSVVNTVHIYRTLLLISTLLLWNIIVKKICSSNKFPKTYLLPLFNTLYVRIAYGKWTRETRRVPCSESADWRGRCSLVHASTHVLAVGSLSFSLSSFLSWHYSFSVQQPRFYLSPVSVVLLIRLIAPPCIS